MKNKWSQSFESYYSTHIMIHEWIAIIKVLFFNFTLRHQIDKIIVINCLELLRTSNLIIQFDFNNEIKTDKLN